MDIEERYTKTYTCLRSSSSIKVYNALVFIRTKLIRERKGVEKLCRLGVVERVLELCVAEQSTTTASSRQSRSMIDLTLSVLGNMCMEKCARSAVSSSNGIPSLVNILQESNTESIQNRVTRTLANLAQDVSSCEAIHETTAVQLIVEFLKNTENKECRLTCCRALRLLGCRSNHRKKIGEDGGILPVALLLKAGDQELMECSMRTLSDLSDQCSVEYASQVQNAGVMEILIGLTQKESERTKLSHYAFKTLLNLAEQPNIRPSIGNAGGIACLVALMENKTKGYNRVEVLNALCFCCREAVNRVRIREQNVLQIMMAALEDEEFKLLHDRIINALVCFIYDEPSLNVLLSNNLVKVLLQHLQKQADFESCTNTALWHSTEVCGLNSCTQTKHIPMLDSLNTVDRTVVLQEAKETTKRRYSFPSDGGHSRKRMKTLDNRPDPSENPPIISKEGFACLNSEVHMGVTRKGTDMDLTKSDNVFPDDEEGTCQLRQETKNSGRETNLGEGKARSHVYSLDSPTYEAQYRDWTIEEFKASVKCKQSFSPDSLSWSPSSPAKSTPESSPIYPGNYSPLSMTSFYSPVYSPHFSPLRTQTPTSISSSPHSSTYSGYSSPYRSQSPLLETPEASPRSDDASSDVTSNSDNIVPPDHWQYSSDEEHIEVDHTVTRESNLNEQVSLTETGNNQQTANDIVSGSSNPPPAMDSPQVGEQTLDVVDSPQVREQTLDSQQVREQTLDSPQVREQTLDSPQVRERTSDVHISELSNQRKTAEACITQQTDATASTSNQIIAAETEECQTATCTTKITNNLERPAVRATEQNILALLSRVSQMTDPAKYMATEECLSCLLDYLCMSNKPNTRAFRIVCRVLRNPSCLVALLNALAPVYIWHKLLNGIPPVSTEATSPPDSSLNSSDGQDFTSAQKSPSRSLPLENNVDTNITQDGSSLMLDLSFVVESSYGCGTVAHILKRKPHGQRVRCAICLPFLCRSRPAQQKILFEGGGLWYLLQLLKQDSSSQVYKLVVQGLNFLCTSTKLALTLPSASVDIKLRFPYLEMARALTLSLVENGSNLEPSSVSKVDCVYMKSQKDHDVVFLLRHSDDARLTANKSILAASSSVFQAMLEGHYTESRQKEIVIRHTTKEAFLYILHYFHGCDENCSLVKCVHCADESQGFTVDVCLEIMTLANRYLLQCLESYLSTIARQAFLDITTAAHMYHFSILHNYQTLADDCLRYMMIAEVSVSEREVSVEELLSADGVDSCLHNIFIMLRCHLLGWSK